MERRPRLITYSTALVILLSGCGGSAMVQYHDGKTAQAGEYTFVIPRTVIRIEGDPGKPASATAPQKAASLTFTPVPVSTALDGSTLKIFSITDDSSGGFSWVPTTVTSVTYVDQNIIQSIGTAITDNRKAIIDAVFGIGGTVLGLTGFKSATPPNCDTATVDKFAPFVLETFKDTGGQTSRTPTNPCWGYQVAESGGDATTGVASIEGELPLDKKVGWFPYGACKNYKITVVRCPTGDTTQVCKPDNEAQAFSSVVAVSDGTRYRKIALPPKGKITMHSNFCVADVTSDPSPLSSDWEIANQLINNTKSLLQKSSSTGSGSASGSGKTTGTN